MTMATKILIAAILAVTTAGFSSSSWAWCSKLKYSSGGPTQQAALKRANDKGLVKVGQLNNKYGNRIKYQTAAFNCTGGNKIRCTITQKYCVSGGKSQKMLKRNEGGFISVSECKRKGMIPEMGYCVEND